MLLIPGKFPSLITGNFRTEILCEIMDSNSLAASLCNGCVENQHYIGGKSGRRIQNKLTLITEFRSNILCEMRCFMQANSATVEGTSREP